MNKYISIFIIILLLTIAGIEAFRAHNEYVTRFITENNNIKMQELKQKEISAMYRGRGRD